MAILEAVFANKAGQTPQDVDRRRKMAEELLKAGTGTKPPSSGLELAGRLAMTLTGQYQAGKADRQDAANRASASTLLANTLLGTPGQTGGSMPSVSPSGQIPAKPTTGKEWDSIAPRLVSDLAKDFQLTPEQAAGVVGQLGHESAGFGTMQEVNPTVPGSRGGYGYAQWTGPRRKQFEAWTGQNNLDPNSYEANYGFLKNELANSPEGAVLGDLRGAPDAMTAGRMFTDKFLRPGTPNYGSRDAWTQKALAFANQPAASTPGEVASLDPSVGIPMPGAAGQMRANSPTQPMPQPQPQMAAAQPAPALPPATNVSTPPVPPNAQQPNSMTALIPPEFQGSQQLMNADPNKGIMQALLGGTPASPEQLARAQQIGNQPQAPAAQDRRGQIAALLQNPYTQELGQQMLMQEYQRQQEASDPLRQLQLQEAQIKIDQARNPQNDYDYVKMEDGTLVRTNKRGGAPEVVFQGKPKPEAKPSAVQEYEYAKEQGFPGTFQDWEASKKGGMSLQVDPDTGAVTFQQGGNIKPMTEGQSKDAVFSTRAAGALPLIDKFGDSLTGTEGVVGGTVGQLPVVGNFAKTEGYQQAEQAGKEFLQAILRKDTGAAITQEETAEYGSVYLPRPGDSKELLAQKKASRVRALEAIKAGMPPQAILAQEKALANTAKATESKETDAPPEGIDPKDWEFMDEGQRKLFR